MTSLPPAHLYSQRPVDLAAVDAVGFDMDHTLALYDDAAVNELAAAAARRLLVEHLGYPAALARAPRAMEAPSAARTLAADLRHGAVVKLGADRRVLCARIGGRWLEGEALNGRFAHPVPDDAAHAYDVHSPFELPVLWLLEELETIAPARGHRAPRCADVRRMLDLAHTNGTLKTRLRADLARFVSGIAGVAAGLARWTDAGKKLFVVTNSEPDYAIAVLDRAVGPAWRDLFALVVTDARKPSFFLRPRPASHAAAHARAPGRVLERGDGALVEELLGAGGERVLFVGDNAQADIRAARAHGWLTAHVVPELGVAGDDAWGAPLVHAGRPTWLARLVREHADVVCDRVDRLLALAPDAVIPPGPAAKTP
jgi:HAD superfamily 5'-nucleotidase-like hydrolase